MQKQEAKHRQVQSQPAVRQEKGRAVESPYGQRIAQLSAMVGSSQQAVKQRQLAMLIGTSPAMTAQRQILEGMITSTTQRQEDEELLQGKFETTQRIEEEEPLQGKLSSSTPAQLKEESTAKTNTTGLPDNLKSGIESLSGMSLDNIKVHYNSAQPAQLNALAYAQGTDIHVAPGQEQHLPHEAWHVVQQAQGRVKPTMQMKDGVPINDDQGLEHEADVMGAKALQMKSGTEQTLSPLNNPRTTIQRYAFNRDGDDFDYGVDFCWHLSSKSGDALTQAAIQSSKDLEGNYWTLINQSSLEGGTFNDVATTGSYHFAIDVEGVEAVSASSRHKTNEKIDSVVVEGYEQTTKAGQTWYKITHLRCAQ